MLKHSFVTSSLQICIVLCWHIWDMESYFIDIQRKYGFAFEQVEVDFFTKVYFPTGNMCGILRSAIFNI